MLRKLGHENINMAIYYLKEQGLVEDTINNLKLLFMYNIPDDDNVAMEIKDYENIGMYYDLHIGKKNIKACDNCGKPIKVKSNRTKYCNICSEENIRELWKNNKRKQRNRMS